MSIFAEGFEAPEALSAAYSLKMSERTRKPLPVLVKESKLKENMILPELAHVLALHSYTTSVRVIRETSQGRMAAGLFKVYVTTTSRPRSEGDLLSSFKFDQNAGDRTASYTDNTTLLAVFLHGAGKGFRLHC
jgi:hypothetical protein